MSREIVMNTLDQFDWVQLGGAVKHPDEGKVFDISADAAKQSGVTDANLKIYCSSGYGNQLVLRNLISVERPDAILHFTDPRFWGWLYAMEHEIRREIPIMYYTIWDAPPAPKYNRGYYESCDLLMCISKQTYGLVNQVLEGVQRKVTYVPHGINSKAFYPITETSSEYDEFLNFKKTLLQDKEFEFIILYNSRNIRRKHTSDIILAYKEFCDQLPPEKSSKCLLLLHTDPIDEHGTDLVEVIKTLCPDYHVSFTTKRMMPTTEMNYLYNLSDVTINLSSNEGFGLSTAESLMAGTPIIVNVTGGLQDQCGFKDHSGDYLTEEDYNKFFETNAVRKYTDHGVWAKPVFPKVRTLQGSPATPYIFDDLADYHDAAEALSKWYNTPAEVRRAAGLEGREYVCSEGAGMSAVEMGKRVKRDVTELLQEWTPRPRAELIKI